MRSGNRAAGFRPPKGYISYKIVMEGGQTEGSDGQDKGSDRKQRGKGKKGRQAHDEVSQDNKRDVAAGLQQQRRSTE